MRAMYAKWFMSGWGMGVPIGVTLFLGDTVFINGQYILNWKWSNEAFESDILHTGYLGIGFKLGK